MNKATLDERVEQIRSILEGEGMAEVQLMDELDAVLAKHPTIPRRSRLH
jgi:hypothetical protein